MLSRQSVPVYRFGYGTVRAFNSVVLKTRVDGAIEDHEERVALGALLAPTMSRERGAQQLTMALQHGAIGLATELVEQARGPLDVREQERLCAAGRHRRVGHGCEAPSGGWIR